MIKIFIFTINGINEIGIKRNIQSENNGKINWITIQMILLFSFSLWEDKLWQKCTEMTLRHFDAVLSSISMWWGWELFRGWGWELWWRKGKTEKMDYNNIMLMAYSIINILKYSHKYKWLFCITQMLFLYSHSCYLHLHFLFYVL